MTIRSTLLGIGGLFWLGALGCWLRAHGSERRWKEGLLFVLLGLPFLLAGAFHTASNYPGESPPIAEAARPTPGKAKPPPIRAPRPAPADPQAHAVAVRQAQLAAVARYPDLGIAGTPFNGEFLDAVRRQTATNPAFFNDPDWPLHLADEIARKLTTEP